MQRVAWISPLLGVHRSPAAAFSALVVPELRQTFELEIFTGDAEMQRREAGDLPLINKEQGEHTFLAGRIFHFHRLAAHHRERPFDYFVYNFEDSEDCRFVGLSASIWPGLAIMHDIRLNRMYRSRFMHSTAAKDINEMMDALFGPQSTRLGDHHVRGWPLESFDRLYHCGKNEAKEAGALFGFDEFGLRHLRSEGIMTPMVAGTPPALVRDAEVVRVERQKSRKALGLGAKNFVVGYCGSERLVDRVGQTLSAYAHWFNEQANKDNSEITLLWLLGHRSQRATTEDALTMLRRWAPEAAASVQVVLKERAEDFRETLSAMDVLCSLRLDDLRGLSRSLLDALAAGIPAIVADRGASFNLSGGAALGVEPGQGEERAIRLALGELYGSAQLREELSSAARTFISEQCRPAVIAEDIKAVLRAEHSRLQEVYETSELRYQEGRRELLHGLSQSVEKGQDTLRGEVAQWPGIDKTAVEDFGWGSR